MLNLRAVAAIAVLLGSASAASANLVTNGNFEAGNSGFGSDYAYFDYLANSGLDMSEAKYTVATDAVLPHHLFTSFGDHTSGAGNYMIVNGSNIAGAVVWSQGIFVTTDTNYNFSAWLDSVYDASPASLQMVVTSFTAARSTLPSSGDTVIGTLLLPAPPGTGTTSWSVSTPVARATSLSVSSTRIRISMATTSASTTSTCRWPFPSPRPGA